MVYHNVKDAKLSKNVKCQIAGTMEEVHTHTHKKKTTIDTMKFTHIDINFDVTCKGHQSWSKILSMNILRGFGSHHM